MAGAPHLHRVYVLPRYIGDVQQATDSCVVDADERAKGLNPAHRARDQRAHLHRGSTTQDVRSIYQHKTAVGSSVFNSAELILVATT